ncbi:hypothetical protein TNIN_101921 [Trichonephila inaurata madagascariensis]|uniref:Uncharacterized protein n=1 Tax=Trichonephila inaurata madagascariensis TaxID=2747483 RepID=A0A8X7CGK2_9ARAC|nr:hypothetical protein TNIN_101921 [Trichonephila inaurata madagascariensis]
MAFSSIISSEKARTEKSRFEMMLLTCFDSQGSIHKEFLPERTTMNAARYIRGLVGDDRVKSRHRLSLMMIIFQMVDVIWMLLKMISTESLVLSQLSSTRYSNEDLVETDKRLFNSSP